MIALERTIHKFKLQRTAIQRINTNGNPIPRHVAMQDGEITVWVEVDIDGTGYLEMFIRATGQVTSGQGAKYLGTVHDDRFVWHLYFW